jgi:LuxR family maltose regulon positive regulatory protein
MSLATAAKGADTRRTALCVDLMVSKRPPSRAHRTTVRFTTRERQLIEAILAGLRNREIAHLHRVSEQTVKNQLKTLFRKVGVSSRLQLAMRAANGRLVIDVA